MKDTEKRNESATVVASSNPALPAESDAARIGRRMAPMESAAALDSLGQLREILFGSSQRELERRISRADAHLAMRAHELEQESRRRLEVLEAHLAKETEALTTRLERELSERGDMLRAITREHRESSSAIEQRVGKSEERMTQIQRELRLELLAQAKSFLDELHRLRQELAETLERELGVGAGSLEESSHGYGDRPHS